MKIDVSILQQLAPTYGVQPLQAVPQVILAINAGASEQAPSEAETILSEAGYTWAENMLGYKNGEQLVFFITAPQQPFFVWIWKKSLMRAFDSSQKLAKWVIGDEKYPEGKGNKFMALYSKAIGGDDMDRSKGGDITFTGTGERSNDYKSSKVDPTDALIAKLTKQAGSSKKLPSDIMIDVGLKAKKEKNDKLLNFLKTISPIKEEKLKRSQLETLIKEIIRGILSEGVIDPIRKSDPDAFHYASQVWGKNNWRIGDSRKTKYGTVYKMVINKPISRFLWLTPKGEWKALDPKTRTWNVIQSVSEMSGTSATAPISTPIAFKKSVDEGDEADAVNDMWAVSDDDLDAHGMKDKYSKKFKSNDKSKKQGIAKVKGKEIPIDEMTTTGDVSGYNIPGAFAKKGGSQKGLEGSAALGFTLTPTGEKDMQRQADKI